MPRADSPYGLPYLRSASCRSAESSEVTLAFMNLKASKLSGWSGVGKEPLRFFAAPSLKSSLEGEGRGLLVPSGFPYLNGWRKGVIRWIHSPCSCGIYGGRVLRYTASGAREQRGHSLHKTREKDQSSGEWCCWYESEAAVTGHPVALTLPHARQGGLQ